MLDLFGLHAKAADFYLIIDAANDLDTVIRPTRQITRTIKTQGLTIG